MLHGVLAAAHWPRFRATMDLNHEVFGVTENDHADVKRLSFEKAIEELESIVKRLEEGKVPLEESVAIYERGEALKRRCEELLRQAEARVEKITLDSSGKPKGSEPLDVG